MGEPMRRHDIPPLMSSVPDPARRARPAISAGLAGPTLLAAVLLVFSTGCPNTGVRPTPPRDARQALERINANLAKIHGALYCKALTSFRFRDQNGRDRRFIAQPATVIFERPRCLYFDIKHGLGGSVARIGSNDEQYWLWIDTPETRKLWHGQWDLLRAGRARELAIPPDQLLDALLLRPLPDELPGTTKPLLLKDGDAPRLLYPAAGRDGWPYVKRELRLDPRPPYMPLEIIDRLADGRVAMRAYLKSYRPVAGTGREGPQTARRYVVYWEVDQAEMRLDFSDVRYRTKETPFCEFPYAWDGDIESLDKPPAPDVSKAGGSAAEP